MYGTETWSVPKDDNPTLRSSYDPKVVHTVVSSSGASSTKEPPRKPKWYATEDWITVWWGWLQFCVVLIVTLPTDYEAQVIPRAWTDNPMDTWTLEGFLGFILLNVVVVALAVPGFLFIVKEKKWIPATKDISHNSAIFHAVSWGLALVTLVSVISLWIGTQTNIKKAGLSNEAWALMIGIAAANLVPLWRPLPAPMALMGKAAETFIKVGLVLLGIGLHSLGDLGYQGAVVAIPVTAVVLTLGYACGRYMMREDQTKLAMLISAGCAVCGSSAATAVQATIGASAQDLTLCIGILSVFTIFQMVVTPAVAVAAGLAKAVIAAALGGTINSTGAVVAAASFLNHQEWVDVASVVKMIQNAMIGVVAVFVLLYWQRFEDRWEQERQQLRDAEADDSRIPASFKFSTVPWYVTFWQKFPKFVIGFLGLSVALTILHQIDADRAKATRKLMVQVSNWWFTLGFVGIGFATQLKKLYKTILTPPEDVTVKDSAFKAVMRPLGCYMVTQFFNIVITFSVAQAMFHNYVPDDDLAN